MTTPMLGGDVVQIQQGAAAYRTLGENLQVCGGRVVSSTHDVVARLEEQISTAQNEVVSSVQAVSNESRTVMSSLGGITWTGTNRTQVEEVGSELDARVTETTARIQELFETFRSELGRLGGELSEVANQFNTVALSAGESAGSLGRAMDAQAAQLDEVMNTGISRT